MADIRPEKSKKLSAPPARPPLVSLHRLPLPLVDAVAPLPAGPVAVEDVVGHHLEVAVEAVLVGAAGDRVAAPRRRRRVARVEVVLAPLAGRPLRT